MILNEQVMNELKQSIYKQPKKRYDKCLWAKTDCNKDSINAHSIQNSKTLDRLVYKNHVYMAVPKQDLDGVPDIEFKLVGRNKATTFTGLCSQHDRELFLPIDCHEFDINNEEQKFLIAYRSVLRELHSRMKAANDIQEVCQKFVESNSDNPKVEETKCIPIPYIVKAYNFYIYKQAYDNIYKGNLLTEIEHDYIRIENKNCPLAVSSLIPLIDDKKFIVFNVFPQENDITILFSYMKSHKKDLSHYINNIKNTSDECKLYLLSKIILRYCENFVLSPEHFNTFSSGKIDTIKTFYYKTSKSIDYDYDHQDLMLF